MSRFAAMARTDHSMRPPMPAATIAYKSPNACNQCHTDHDAPWADQWVRKWYPRDYQAEPLRRAALLDAARKSDWKRLPEMLADVQNKQGDEIYRNSLVRLLRNCTDPQKWPVLIAALKDDSPLVRASAAAALEGYLTDGERLRRCSAPRPIPCGWCGSAPRRPWPPCIPSRLTMPTRENRFAGRRPSSRRRWRRGPTIGPPIRTLAATTWKAATSTRRSTAFETALKLEPRVVAPMVNLSMAYANLKQNDKAEAWLRRALKAEPDNAAANFNLGLLLAETDRLDEAEKALRAALKSDPQLAPAAYNLAVILGEKKDLAGAVEWCRKAHDLRPEELKYTQSLAFYLNEKGDKDEAAAVLKKANRPYPQRSAVRNGLHAAVRDECATLHSKVLAEPLPQGAETLLLLGPLGGVHPRGGITVEQHQLGKQVGGRFVRMIDVGRLRKDLAIGPHAQELGILRPAVGRLLHAESVALPRYMKGQHRELRLHPLRAGTVGQRAERPDVLRAVGAQDGKDPGAIDGIGIEQLMLDDPRAGGNRLGPDEAPLAHVERVEEFRVRPLKDVHLLVQEQFHLVQRHAPSARSGPGRRASSGRRSRRERYVCRGCAETRPRYCLRP